MELYEALAEGLAEQVCPRGQVRPAQQRRLAVQSDDAESMAVDFLGQLLGLMQTQRFFVHEVRVRSASPVRVEATVLGEPYDPARHTVGQEVKAVTYHMLQVRQDGDAWTGQVLLDL